MSWDDSDDDIDLDELDRFEKAILEARKVAPNPQPLLVNQVSPQKTQPELSQQHNNPSYAANPSLPIQQNPSQQPQPTQQPLPNADGQPQPPNSYSELLQRIAEFAPIAPLIPPQPPPSLVCRGIYGTGCGGTLEYVQFHQCMTDGLPPPPPFWGCSKYHARGNSKCEFRLSIAKVLDYPRLDIMIVDPGTIEVFVYPGAERAVEFCGGVARILYLVRVDLERAVRPRMRGSEAEGQQKEGGKNEEESAAVRPGSGHITKSVASPARAPPPSALHALPPPDPALLKGVTQPKDGTVRFPLSYYPVLKVILQRPLQRSTLGGVSPSKGTMGANGAMYRSAEKPKKLLPADGGIPKGTLEAFRNKQAFRAPSDELESRYACLPPHLEAALLPFQKQGVRFGLERRGRCLLGDEMGVGKTVQALALAAAYRRDSWPLLAIVPSSMRIQWAEEFEKWLPGLSPGSIHMISDKFDELNDGGKKRVAGIAGNSTAGIEAGGIGNERLPQICITSFRMLEHLTCNFCKKGREYRDIHRGAGGGPGAGASGCLYPDKCMASKGWRMVIVDESHTLRTTSVSNAYDSLQTEAARATAKNAERLIFLSGTPSINKPYDLYNQVSMLRPDLLEKTKKEFAAQYCNLEVVPRYYWKSTGGQVLCKEEKRYDASGLMRGPELHLMLKEEVMIRRLKKDVLDQLPPKRRQVIRLPKPPVSEWPVQGDAKRRKQDDSDASSDEEEEEEGPGGAGAGSSEPAKKMSAQHRTGIAKSKSVCDWIIEKLGIGSEDLSGTSGGGGSGDGAGDAEGGSSSSSSSGPTKIIVFAHHRLVMNALHEKLGAALAGRRGRYSDAHVAAVGTSTDADSENRGYKLLRIDGETPAEERREVVERFRYDPTVRIALLSVTAAGTGLDFSAASAVVFAELPSEVSLVRQAEDRAHRHGQKNPVNVYFLCARGTCDERHWQRLSNSLERVNIVHDGPEAAKKEGGCGAGGLVVDEVMNIVDEAEERLWGVGNEQAGATAADADAPEEKEQGKEDDAMAATPTAKLQNKEAEPAVDQAEGTAMEASPLSQPPPSEPAPSLPQPSPSVVELLSSSEEEEERTTPQKSVSVIDLTESPLSSIKTKKIGTAAAAVTGRAATRPMTSQTLASSIPPSIPDDQWWFEVSAHTHRLHFHAAPDRSKPLLLSLRMEALAMDADGNVPPPVLSTIAAVKQQLEAVKKAEARAVVSRSGAAGASAHQSSIPSPSSSSSPSVAVVPGVGPIAIDLSIVKRIADLESALAAARAFAAEWRELPNNIRSRLYNKVLQIPLEDAIDAAFAEAEAEGAYGTSKERFLSAAAGRKKLPEGTEWTKVTVRYDTKFGREVVYEQPIQFTTDPEKAPTGAAVDLTGDKGSVLARLCLHCLKPVPESARVPLDKVSVNGLYLFCSAECQRKYAIKSSGGAARRLVFKRDRGVCECCKVDCCAVMRHLQAIERGSKRWRDRRMQVLQQHYSSFLHRLKPKAAEALIERATAGKAWQADHIRAVYQGGGQCDVDNLRTLCTPCHQEVTAQQAKDRAKQRKAARKALEAAEQQVASRRMKRERNLVDESDDEEGGGARGGAAERGKGGNGRGRGRMNA